MAKKDGASNNGKQKGLRDISPILDAWSYEPGTINVRKIRGLDGALKLQMRVDLGLFQMELKGRPDGRRPHGCESLLSYYERRLATHRRQHGSTEGFHLTAEECQALREEAMMYYQRYISLFMLRDFSAVARDTRRNLRVLDLCSSFADDEQDRLVLEQYRPYIIMMHTRALANVEVRRREYRAALKIIKRGLNQIRQFFVQFGHEEDYKRCGEARILRRCGRQILRKLPANPTKLLKKQLDRAIVDERYEEAAEIRDQLAKLGISLQQPKTGA